MSPINESELTALRANLLAKRDHVSAELERLAQELASFGVEQELEAGALSNHLADDGSNVQSQEQILRFSADLSGVKTQIEEALERLENGTYGTCQRCGKPINPERLEAFPYVAYCIECQSIIERQGQSRPASVQTR